MEPARSDEVHVDPKADRSGSRATSRAVRVAMAALWTLGLAACPQEIQSSPDAGSGAGGDAGEIHVTPRCERAGPTLACNPDKSGLLRIGDLVTIDCSAETDGRAVVFDGPEVDHPRVSRQGSFAGAGGQVLVQLLESEVGPGFADTRVHVDVGAHWADDEESCTWVTVEVTYAGNLWIADPSKEAVIALSSAGGTIGQVSVPEIRKPRLLAKVHDGILVGGTDASGKSALVVYSPDGQKVRGPLADGGQLADRVLHSAAEDGHGVLYVATGRDETDGRLFKAAGAEMIEVDLGGKLPRGVARLPDGSIAVGLAQAAGVFYKLPPGGQGHERISPPYADSTGESCQVESVFALAATSEGLWLSARERIGAAYFGHHILIDYGTSRLVRASAHDHPDRGSLFLAAPHDWLAEVVAGVFVATRKDSTAIELLDPVATGSFLPNGKVWGPEGGQPYQGQPRGLLRLR